MSPEKGIDEKINSFAPGFLDATFSSSAPESSIRNRGRGEVGIGEKST